MKQLYLIGGPMGVGKTTVGQTLKTMLPGSVYLDGDWCWDAHPFQVTEGTKAMVLDNICHLLTNFLKQPEYAHVIFCWVMDEQSILDALLARLPTEECRVHLVSLVAQPQTLAQRVDGDIRRGLREPGDGERSLARLPRYAALPTKKLDTTGKTPEQVVKEILNG